VHFSSFQFLLRSVSSEFSSVSFIYVTAVKSYNWSKALILVESHILNHSTFTTVISHILNHSTFTTVTK